MSSKIIVIFTGMYRPVRRSSVGLGMLQCYRYPKNIVKITVASRSLCTQKSNQKPEFKEFIENMKEKVEKDTADSNQNPRNGSKSPFEQFGGFPGRVPNIISLVQDNIKQAWDDMTGSSKESSLRKTLKQAETYKPRKVEETEGEADEEEKYNGPTALVLVKEPLSAWEHMKHRLQDSPLIREVLKGSKYVGKIAADTDIGKRAQKVGQNIKDKVEDAREFWETSQNPVVYALSGVWENMTGETEEALAIASIRKLDPTFITEEWAAEVTKSVAPVVLKSHLLGETKILKPLCGTAVFNKLSAEIAARKSDGLTFDPNILDIEEKSILMKILEDGSVVILLIYQVQQINCIRDREGNIREGGETDIRAKFYAMAFQQIYDEDTSEVQWLLADYELHGDIPYF